MPYPALATIFSVLLFPAIFMVSIPMMPVLSYMLAVSLLFGLIDNFVHLTAGDFGVLAGIWALSLLVDHLSGILGAKYAGASKKSLIGGFVGAIVGTAFLPPFGGLLGIFLGVFLTELIGKRTNAEAFKSAKGSFLGALTGIIINTILAISFFALFVFFVI